MTKQTTIVVAASLRVNLSFWGTNEPRQENAFEHAQNERIYISLHMRSLIRAFVIHWNIL